MLFPWATLTIDEEFYRSYDKEQYELECGEYSYGLKGYIDFTQSYAEWVENDLPTGIRPYLDDNEVLHWRLELKLNKVGDAFLRLENYLINP